MATNNEKQRRFPTIQKDEVGRPKVYQKFEPTYSRDEKGNFVRHPSPVDQTIINARDKAAQKVGTGFKRFGDVAGKVLDTPRRAVKAYGVLNKAQMESEKISKERNQKRIGGKENFIDVFMRQNFPQLTDEERKDNQKRAKNNLTKAKNILIGKE